MTELVYRQFAHQLDALQNIVYDPVIASRDMQMTPAGRLMLNRNPLNFTQLFAAYVAEYQNIWAWNPGPKTPQGAEVCDGVAMFGQCASFSRGLHLLGRYYDPSYNTEYTTLDEMAVYELDAGTIQRGGHSWESATNFAGKRYFKTINLVHGGVRIPVEGPFNALP